MLSRRLVMRLALLTSAAGAVGLTWLSSPAATWGAGPSAVPTGQAAVTIEAGDYYFGAPDVVEGGWVTVDFTNRGTETHHAQLVRLPDELPMEQFAAALQGDERAALGVVRQVGGAAAVDTGWSTEVTVNLDAGTYALICVIPSPSDRIRHFAKGMVKPLVVTAPSVAADPPVASGTIHLRDFTIDMPDVVPAGGVTYQVVNDGPAQPHEVAIVHLTPDKTAEDARQAIMNPGGPPPFQPVGGFQAIDAGGTGFVTLNLEPGEYAAICRVTEPLSGQSHVHLGMVKSFRVA